MISRILFSRSKARMASAAALSIHETDNLYENKSEEVETAVAERPCIHQPILTGKWEDSVGMFRFQIIPAKKHTGYHVINKFYKGGLDISFLDYVNNESTNITFGAPWGPNDSMRYYNGSVSPNGRKIIWFGKQSYVEWFKIC
jgi:hypothetical protein